MTAVLATLLTSLLGAAHARPPPAVLVELFTSEGCSSCPPADALLERLTRAQGSDGARVVALGEHVDYWDDLGWKDAFSSPVFTRRQERYAQRLGSGVYTPQLVVAGGAHVLGSDEAAARAAIAAALRAARGVVTVRVEAGALAVEARWTEGVPGDVLLALVRDRASSRVVRGENAGRVLTHVAIARTIAVVGAGRGAFSARVPLAASDADRAVAFVQEPGGGAVLAVGDAPLR